MKNVELLNPINRHLCADYEVSREKVLEIFKENPRTLLIVLPRGEVFVRWPGNVVWFSNEKETVLCA